MNLTIDIGNTRSKIVLFCNDQVQEAFAVESDLCEAVQKVMQTYDIQAVAWSAVGRIPEGFEAMLSALPCPVARLEWHSPIAFNRKYQTPEGMGADRIAADIAAVAYSPGHNVLVIDAGSAITYDFIDAEGNYHGGNIAPGIEMRLAALHEHTNKLPHVGKEGETPTLGYDTETAIRSGVINGIIYEIEGYIAELKKKHPELLVFLTGGDQKSLIYKIKSCIFADEFLVLKGLNRILTHHDNI